MQLPNPPPPPPPRVCLGMFSIFYRLCYSECTSSFVKTVAIIFLTLILQSQCHFYFEGLGNLDTKHYKHKCISNLKIRIIQLQNVRIFSMNGSVLMKICIAPTSSRPQIICISFRRTQTTQIRHGSLQSFTNGVIYVDQCSKGVQIINAMPMMD